jgi:hypothetical protein
MKLRIGCNQIAATIAVLIYLVSALVAPTVARAQNLKCFILTPPEQLLEGVKKVAIMDLAVTAEFHADDPPSQQKKSEVETLLDVLTRKDADKNKQKFSDSGVKLTDMMIALLLEEDRGIHEVDTGFLGLGSKEGKSFQRQSNQCLAVVERSRIAQVLNELQLGQSGFINEAQAAQVGKSSASMPSSPAALPCHAMIAGRRKSARTRKEQVYRGLPQRTVNTSASIRFIKIETGQVIGSKQSSFKSEPEICGEKLTDDLPRQNDGR